MTFPVLFTSSSKVNMAMRAAALSWGFAVVSQTTVLLSGPLEQSGKEKSTFAVVPG